MKKFNLLDNVYFMDGSKITQGKILGKDSIKTSLYNIHCSGGDLTRVHEEELFSSVEAVLDHLSSTVDRLDDE